MKLSLPVKFKNVIEKNSGLNGALLIVIDKFSDWLGANKTEFFPEYTDHGIDHIQSVFNTAEDIITNNSWGILTAEDVYVLISSILLHDCAMHLTKSGLWDLISNDVYNGVLLGFPREDEWASRWRKFTSDVKKFDESDLIKFFGEDRVVELPDIGSDSFSDNQKVIIGDFVRQYHACISQIIATHGMPTKSGPYVLFDNSFKYLNELSGLVARSHNHSLRSIVDLLDSRKREYRNTHPTYIMGVLRIADYLQFKEDRTPKILFNIMSFCSPISIKEWKKHLAVISANTLHPDDELLFVEAYPDDAKTLVGINSILVGLQKELDEFWAVNGEVYSRYPQVKNLSITFRRVKSNIDDAKKYVEQNYKSYYPEILSIKSDNQKLFPLLIKPLYGNYPRVGFRELLQNGLDACNERFCLEQKTQSNNKKVPFNINVEINFDRNTFTIKDQGVGMDVEVIKNYFLKIGSSYRTSEVWKSSFILGNNSLVPRTGKFGIGMLAGFLIGNKIEVSTRSHKEANDKSVLFTYELDSNEIELSFTDNQDVGTSITINSNSENLADIESGLNSKTHYNKYQPSEKKPLTSWWYYLDSPEVVVNIIKNGVVTRKKIFHEIKKEHVFSKWNCISDSELDGLYWVFSDLTPFLYCNGIVIQGFKTPAVCLSSGVSDMIVSNLEICVFDNKGVFPLNLTRDSLAIDIFFEIDKINSSVKAYLIGAIKSELANYEFSQAFILGFVSSACYKYRAQQLCPLVFTSDKVIPFSCGELFESKGFTLVDFISTSQRRGVIYESCFSDVLNGLSYSYVFNVDKQASAVEWAICSFILNKSYVSYNVISKDTGLKIKGWLFVKNYDISKVNDHFFTRIPKELSLKIKQIDDVWSVVTTNGNENYSKGLELSSELIKLKDSKFFMFAVYKADSMDTTEFASLWNEMSI